jgi:signal transduction histidine kinase
MHLTFFLEDIEEKLFQPMNALPIIICIIIFAGAQINHARPPENNSNSTNGTAVQLTAEEQAWLKNHSEVRWGADPDWPPFSSWNRNNQLIGIDADIVRLVAARVGLRVKPVIASSWPEVFAKAKAGEVDFLSATAKTPERLAIFDYTEQYGVFPVVIITRDDAPFLTTSANLQSLRISEPRGNVITWRLQQDCPSTNIVLTDNAEQAIRLVSLYRVDATVQNLAVASRVIRVNGLTNLKIAGVTRYEFPLSMAVRKDMPELRAILDKGLATITPSEVERIYAAHLTPDIDKARNWGLWRRVAIDSVLIGGVIIGSVVFWNCCLVRQIRQRRTAEASLRETRDRLEERTYELDRRITEAQRLNAELRVANQDLESFSSSVSHDLRSPLRRIGTFTELLKLESGDRISEEAAQWLTTIMKETKNMDHLIHDLLEFARLGRAELRKQPVRMRELVMKVIADFRGQTANRKVVWKIGDLGEVDGDPHLLRYALVNLIDNALKYTRRRAEARITIDVCPNTFDDVSAVLFVQDNGSGFEMCSAKNLFKPFERLHKDQEFEGTGMGLANVQRIIQRHGGRIWCESEPDKGATFYFTLSRSTVKALAS